MLELRVDPWQPDHGMGFEPSLVEPPARADPFVETEDWSRPLRPPPRAPGQVWFVDGVRRVELRVVATQDGRRAYGLFGSFAVGAVRSDGRAGFGPHAVDRVLVLGSGLVPAPVDVEVGGARLSYRAVSEPGSDPDHPLHRLQKEMQGAEVAVALEVAESQDRLVLADGRWESRERTEAPVVGVVKRWSRGYLLPEHEALVPSLVPGERTPLFGLVEPDETLSRYAWYARVAPLRPEWHPQAGVVRCEVAADLGVGRAREVADRVTALLPGFAGRRGDPRFPQNLAPVAALEGWLRHRLGHPGLIRRALTARLHEGLREGLPEGELQHEGGSER
ncbi:MAG TPA: hypothetical protein VNO34_01435 [Actinomycetota bacterium]|nr:hypothetical protein [Actinomycetota bacterium]